MFLSNPERIRVGVCVFVYKGEAESMFAGLGKVNPGFSQYRKPLISANENCRPY